MGSEKPSNLGLCNKCKARVPSEFVFRDGQVWIRKDCPTCGPNEALVSTDAAVWQAKRDMWHYVPTENPACTLNCDKCRIDHKPNMVFLDVTNRCNMNCPICIATIRGMGFDFNPPLEYFEKIFEHLGRMTPRPVVQLFGGEPTVRDDLLEIIAIAKKHGLRPHVVTNGVRLADEELCKKLCEARVPLRFGFDGRNADIYERLRNNRWAYDKKMKALANLKKYSKRKHAIIATAAYGVNDMYMADFFDFVHENRDLVSDVGIIPLTENWEPGTFDAAKTTTMEDVEKMVQAAIPGGQVEFVPAGLSYAIRKSRSFFRKEPRSEVLLLAGVHPNCESITLLISDGQHYRSVSHYLKKSFKDVVLDMAARCKKIEPSLDRLDPTKFFQRQRGRIIIVRALLPWGLASVKFVALADGKPVRALLKLIWKGIFGKKAEGKLSRSRRPRRLLRVGMLPFEEQHSVDAARMESCKAVFAYEDPADGKVKTIPACLWYPYRNAYLKGLSEKYGVVRGGKVIPFAEATVAAKTEIEAKAQ
jgi:7,8-dihydro-6-hydroxymethylpterin dimethyltransferase